MLFVLTNLLGLGSIHADGGKVTNSSYAGAGGGGRIAVYASDYSGFALTNLAASGGRAGYPGGPGTVYVKGAGGSVGTLVIDAAGGGSGTTPLGLAESNTFAVAVPVVIRGNGGLVRLEHPGIAASFGSSLRVEGGVRLEVEGPVTLGGQLVVDGATVVATNIAGTSLLLTNDSLLTTFASSSARVCALQLSFSSAAVLSSDSRIDVTGKGYLGGRTSGNTTTNASTGRSGGSYGGSGGMGVGVANAVYGDYADPRDWGSGAADTAAGGGLV